MPGHTFEGQVRDALAHLYDVPYLQAHPLARFIRGRPGVRDAALGQALQRGLTDAVEALRPAEGAARSGRAYELMRLRYVDALEPPAVWRALGISKTEYYRENTRALNLVVARLRDEWSAPTSAADAHDASNSAAVRVLPVFMTSFLGRDDEVADVTRLLATTRLLTLTGPAGAGKTRLAAALAARVSGRVVFVPLGPLPEADLVTPTIARALGMHEAAGKRLAEAIVEHIGSSALMLVLDNFEHVLPAATLVGELLASCPELKVLATSRAPLRLSGEQEYPVPPLAEDAAARLFAERARAAQPSFALSDDNTDAVTDLCARLDRLPLAIELAAARVKLLEPAALLARLDTFAVIHGPRLAMLADGPRDVPHRQQSLRNALAWSHDLLGPAQQACFRRLAVFVGGFSLEAAEAVVGARVGDVATLVDQSLLHPVEGTASEPRFAMLETVREYGLELLAVRGELAEVRRAHADHFRDAVRRQPNNGAGFDWREREHGNLRAALTQSVEAGDADAALELVAAVWGFWVMRGHVTEGRTQVARVFALGGAQAPTEARAQVLAGAGRMALNQGDYEAARGHYEECLAYWRERGDPERISAILANVANLERERGDLKLARAHLEEALALAEQLSGKPRTARTWQALATLGLIALQEGDYRAARQRLESARALTTEDIFFDALLVARLGYADHAEGDLASARARFEEALASLRGFGDRRAVANVRANLGLVLVDQGALGEARDVLDQSLAMAADMDDRATVALSLEGFAGLAASACQPARALRLAGAAAGARERIGAPAPPGVAAWLERWIAIARARLDESTADSAWKEGRALPLPRATAEARDAG